MNPTFLLMASSPEAGSSYVSLLFFGLFFMVLYFFMIRPQSQKAKKQRQYIDEIQKGDKVVTIGGIHGKVLKVDDSTLLVEVDSNTKLRIEKSVISMEMTQSATAEKSS